LSSRRELLLRQREAANSRGMSEDVVRFLDANTGDRGERWSLPPRHATDRNAGSMLDLRYVAQHFEEVKESLKLRGGNMDLGPFQALVQERRELHIALPALNRDRHETHVQLKRKTE